MELAVVVEFLTDVKYHVLFSVARVEILGELIDGRLRFRGLRLCLVGKPHSYRRGRSAQRIELEAYCHFFTDVSSYVRRYMDVYVPDMQLRASS